GVAHGQQSVQRTETPGRGAVPAPGQGDRDATGHGRLPGLVRRLGRHRSTLRHRSTVHGEKESNAKGAVVPRVEPVPYEALSDSYQAMIEAGAETGAFTTPIPLQIMAYADHADVPDDGDRHPNFPTHLLPGRLLELLRI